MNNIKNQQRGYVMVLVLIGAMVISATMMSTILVSTKSQKVVKNFKESVQTLNAADTAIKMAKGAINEWLVAQQASSMGGTGSEVYFSSILSASDAADALTIPGNATDWSNLSLFENNVRVRVWDEEGVSDTDRIFVIEAEAINNTSQRVRIQSYVQAPSVINTSGLPGLQGALGMCADLAGLTQEIDVLANSTLTGNDQLSLPGLGCTGNGCHTNDYDPANPDNQAPAYLSDTGSQNVNIAGSADIEGSPAEVITMTGDCTEIRAFVDQVALLSDTLPNVNYVTDGVVNSSDLGTSDNPKVTIVTGAPASPSKSKAKKSSGTASTVTISNNTKGAGILLIQNPTDVEAVAVEGGTNFYYEGLIVIYGDSATTFDTRGTEAMFGGVLVLTGSNDPSTEFRLSLKNKSRLAYSQLALARADAAMGTSSEEIIQVDDPRNSVVTIGWFEDYDF